MIERVYDGVSFRVRYSWEEQNQPDGAVIFTLDPSCLLMLQQLARSGEASDGEFLSAVMEALAPGGEHIREEKDGFAGMSCRYVRESDGQSLQCVSYAFAHGEMISILTLLLQGEHMDSAEATLAPILGSLQLEAVFIGVNHVLTAVFPPNCVNFPWSGQTIPAENCLV
jgi:hypothetical protein